MRERDRSITLRKTEANMEEGQETQKGGKREKG